MCWPGRDRVPFVTEPTAERHRHGGRGRAAPRPGRLRPHRGRSSLKLPAPRHLGLVPRIGGPQHAALGAGRCADGGTTCSRTIPSAFAAAPILRSGVALHPQPQGVGRPRHEVLQRFPAGKTHALRHRLPSPQGRSRAGSARVHCHLQRAFTMHASVAASLSIALRSSAT